MSIKTLIKILMVQLFLLATVGLPILSNAGELQNFTIYSPSFRIDQKFRSMEGSAHGQRFVLAKGKVAELLWIKGYEMDVVSSDQKTILPQEFACHSLLDIHPKLHNEIFAWEEFRSARLFTLSQGQRSIEFPEGYGIPILSTEPLFLATQVLNHNYENLDIEVRLKNTVRFIRDADLKEPLKPLYYKSAMGMVLVEGEDGYYDNPLGGVSSYGKGSVKGRPAAPDKDIIKKDFGRQFTPHWLVPPGRHVYPTLVTEGLNLHYDTVVHYMAAHLHPFAESIALRDLTTGKTILQIQAKNRGEGLVGLSHVASYSSVKRSLFLKIMNMSWSVSTIILPRKTIRSWQS